MDANNIIRGITITPPIIGRITMGHVEIRTGRDSKAKAIPVKDDHFHITTLVQNADRSWGQHPIMDKCLPARGGGKDSKLTRIPIRIIYNDKQLSLHNSYSCFDTEKGRVLCSGDGEKARRATESGVQTVDCPRPAACEYGQRNRCKNFTRFYCQIEGQDDELGVFVLRSTSFNTLSSLASTLAELHGATGGKMAGMPLCLEIMAKSTAQSMRTAVYFARLRVREGMSLFEAVKAAREWQRAWTDVGLDLDGREAELLSGLHNSDFMDDLEDQDEWFSSDDEMVAAATGNLQSAGLRGLDQIREAAKAANEAPAAAAAPQEPAAATA